MNTGQTIDRTRIIDLTIEEVRAYPSFAHFTDKEAREVIETLKQFSRIVYNFYQINKVKALENPKLDNNQ